MKKVINTQQKDLHRKMVVGWLALHEEEAYAAWNLAVAGEHFNKIAPM